MDIVVYTDGSCNNKVKIDRVGGYSSVMNIPKVGEVIIMGGEVNTSSARMELMAVTSTLEYFVSRYEGTQISLLIYTDAQYIEKSFNEGWLWDWFRIKFVNTKNSDLWKRICKAIESDVIKSFSIFHVRGHTGIPLNEKADVYANKASRTMSANFKDNRNNRSFISCHVNSPS